MTRRRSARISSSVMPRVSLFLFCCGLILEVASSASPANADKLASFEEVELTPLVLGRMSSRQARQIFQLPGAQIDRIFNPLLLYPGWMMLWFFIGPGMAAIILGFIWPFYEYLRGGHTYYHPGIIFDKDFSEYSKWYFKHKIYKHKYKYWNLDAYLRDYFLSHNENLMTFFEDREIPTDVLKDYEDGSVPLPPAAGAAAAGYDKHHQGSHGKQQGTATGVSEEPAEQHQKEGVIGQKDKQEDQAMETVLSDVIKDMMEQNPYLQKFIRDMTEGESYKKLKNIVKSVMKEEFGPKNTTDVAALAAEGGEPPVHGAVNDENSNYVVHAEPATAYAAYHQHREPGSPTGDSETDDDLSGSNLTNHNIPTGYGGKSGDVPLHPVYSTYRGDQVHKTRTSTDLMRGTSEPSTSSNPITSSGRKLVKTPNLGMLGGDDGQELVTNEIRGFQRRLGAASGEVVPSPSSSVPPHAGATPTSRRGTRAGSPERAASVIRQRRRRRKLYSFRRRLHKWTGPGRRSRNKSKQRINLKTPVGEAALPQQGDLIRKRRPKTNAGHYMFDGKPALLDRLMSALSFFG